MSFPFGYLDKRYQRFGRGYSYLYTILMASVKLRPAPPINKPRKTRKDAKPHTAPLFKTADHADDADRLGV